MNSSARPHKTYSNGTQSPEWQRPTASILLLCGLPGGGKSTFAQTLINVHKQCRERIIGSNEGTDKSVIDSCLSRFDKVLLIDYDSIAERELRSQTDCNHHGAHEKVKSNPLDGVALDREKLEKEQQHFFDAEDLEAWKKTRVYALNILEDELATHFSSVVDTENIKLKQKHVLIIMDDNFHLRSMRRDVYRKCQEFLTASSVPNANMTDSESTKSILNQNNHPIISFATIYFSTSIETCIQRNSSRNGKQRIPVEVMNRMAKSIEPPNESKPGASFEKFNLTIDNLDNIDELGNVIKFKSNTNIKQKIETCLQESLQSPILPKEELSYEELAKLEIERQRQREETLKCQKQRIDQLLRKLVGAVGRVEKGKSKKANDAKKSIFDRVKRGEFRARNDQYDECVALSFACHVMGLDPCTSWEDLGNDPLVKLIRDTFKEFISSWNKKK